MSNTVFYIITGVAAVVAVILFLRMGKGSSESFTRRKEDEVRRKRAALMSKRKAEAEKSLED